MTVIDIARALIGFDTSGPPTRERPCAEWIRDFLEDLGVEADLQEVDEGRANVVAKIGEDRGPGLLMSGHIDVVLAGDLDLWTVTHPFEPKVKNGRLYGRGSCDMKGPDACVLQALKDLIGEDFKRQLNLVFTSGEDTGGWYVGKVVEEEKITVEDALYGVIPEPSMMEIVRCHKGSGTAVVKLLGRAAHSSTPELGVNAILKASKLIGELVKLQDGLEEKEHPLLGHTTIKPTIIDGGFKSNIIPDSCKVTINSRLIPEHAGGTYPRRWIQDIIDGLGEGDPDFNAVIESCSSNPALDVPEDSSIVEILMEILKKEPIGVPYYTEAVDYTQAGIPTVICGPGSISQAHTANEYIAIDQLEKGVTTFKKLIRRTCL